MTRQTHAPSIPKWRFLLYLIIAFSVAGVVINKAYQRNFDNKALTHAEQQALQVRLLDFPRNMVSIVEVENTSPNWHFFYVQPQICDESCQTHLGQIHELVTPIQVRVLLPDHPHYQEIWALVRSKNYSEHFDKMLLLNPAGKFAGSVSAPYTQDRMLKIASVLQAKQ